MVGFPQMPDRFRGEPKENEYEFAKETGTLANQIVRQIDRAIATLHFAFCTFENHVCN